MRDLDKFLWVMLWWAVGDALWEPVEFRSMWEFEWVSGYLHKNYETWKPEWEWTDDTAMALLLAESLLRCNWTDVIDQLETYVKWHKTWYLWLRDYPAWEWIQTANMLEWYIERKKWNRKDKVWEEDRSGMRMDWNWALMRIWPIPLFFFDDIEEVLKWASDSCISTHNTIINKQCCMFYSGLIRWAMNWVPKEELMKPFYSPIEWYREKMWWFVPEVSWVVEWSYQFLSREELNPSWYIVDSMEAALWWFYNFDNFKDWMGNVVNLWGDTDTIWCIYWYLWWAYYWWKAIPNEWIEWLMDGDRIMDFAKNLYNHKKS